MMSDKLLSPQKIKSELLKSGILSSEKFEEVCELIDGLQADYDVYQVLGKINAEKNKDELFYQLEANKLSIVDKAIRNTRNQLYRMVYEIVEKGGVEC